jgi:3',5'-cyclic-AMP phosphodiesterase
VPVHPIPGNHDDREALRDAFADHPGVAASEGFVQYEARCGGLRVLLCDTLEPGGDGGRYDDERRAWLQRALAEDGAPTIVAMHHPPIVTGIRAWDDIGLPDADREALAALLRERRSVLRVAAGHIHRVITSDVGGVPVAVAPSAWRQAALDLRPDGEIVLGDDRPGYALHVLTDGGALLTHAAVLQAR